MAITPALFLVLALPLHTVASSVLEAQKRLISQMANRSVTSTLPVKPPSPSQWLVRYPQPKLQIRGWDAADFQLNVAKKLLIFAMFLMVLTLLFVFCVKLCVKLCGSVRNAREEKPRKEGDREQEEFTRQLRKEWERARRKSLVGILKRGRTGKKSEFKTVRFEVEEESMFEPGSVENRIVQSLEEEVKQYVQREDDAEDEGGLLDHSEPELEDTRR